jgi:HEAT repeats
MQKQLKEILSKLAAGESLSEGELGYVKELVAERKQDESAPRPLWYWIREQGYKWGRVLDVRFDWPLDGELDPILLDAGAKVDGRLENAVARRNALVTRDALQKAVKKHLTSESTGTRAHATLLIGLCRFEDMVPLVVDSLATGREERQSWGQPVICAGLRTVVMMQHPQARELAAKYTTHEDQKLRQAAQTAHLLDPQISEAELAEALESEFDVALLTNFRDQFIRAVAGGHELKDKITTILDNNYRSVDLCRAVARITVASKWEDKFEELLAHSDADVRGAMACECAWNAEAAWALPLLKARIDDEDDTNVQAAVVAAACSLEPDDDSFWRQQLGSDNNGCRNGALWAAAGHKDRNEAIAEKLNDDDEDVKRSAAALLTLNADSVSPEEVELRYADQTALPSWWTWLIAVKALDAAGVEKPEMVVDFNFTVDEFRPFDAGWLDRARAFYGERPWRLIKRIGPEFVNNEEARKRHVALAGLVGGAALEAALERRLSTAESFWEAQELFVEVRSAGGPTTGIGRVIGKLVCAEQDRPVEMEDGDFHSAVAVAIGRGDETLRARATATLLKFGDRVEPFLYNLLSAVELEVANAAANAVAQLSPTDPYLANVARLMNAEVRRVEELEYLDVLARCNAWRVRAKLAETAGLPENDLAQVKPYLLALVGDTQQEVQLAAMSSLAARAGGELWVKTLLLERSKSQDWRARRHAVDTMAEMADPHFLQRLLELLGQDQDSDVKNSAVKALDAIADKHPERGMLVLDIREPRRVNERYGMEEQYDYSGDQRAEALRLLMVALDRRKNDLAAKGKVGQKVMISRAASADQEAHSARPLTPEEFEKLALYLKVSFADEETGAVVAEVGAEPTGEVLNALLQTESVVVTNATWS